MKHTRSLCLVLLSLAIAWQVGAAVPDVRTIAPGIDLIVGRFSPGSQPDGNSVVLTSRDGLIVIDTGRHAEHTSALLSLAKSRNVPIAAVVNTHWHLDHIGGNARIRAQFPTVKIYASDALRGALDGFLAKYRRDLEAAIAIADTTQAQRDTYRIDLDLLSDAASLAPDIEITTEAVRTIGGKSLEVNLERAATRGDLWLIDRQAQVLIAGDLVTLPAPFLDTACPSRWSAALARLASAEYRTLIPGHGLPMSRAEFAVYRSAFDGLLACAGSNATEAECGQRWIAAIGKLVSDDTHDFARAMIGYYTKQILRNDAIVAANCAE